MDCLMRAANAWVLSCLQNTLGKSRKTESHFGVGEGWPQPFIHVLLNRYCVLNTNQRCLVFIHCNVLSHEATLSQDEAIRVSSSGALLLDYQRELEV
ncbi:hypothetical protein TNCV_4247671 [Trichonephila clavipes]|nr:hypothetical protein TNCV_4247671 [Trichonephila clavipes]